VSDKSAARQNAPQPRRNPRNLGERDTLRQIDQQFLNDQLAALLASPTLARVADRHSEGHDDPSEFDSLDADSERDTEPSLDTQLLRDALNAGLK
jgi:hypothetical protein